MMVRNLGEEQSVFQNFVAEIRDKNVQKDSMRFRRNLKRMGEVFAYEISKQLSYSEKVITTPLGQARIDVLSEQPVIATILRAGLPLHQGLLNYFDQADSAFISAYRKYHSNGTFDVEVEYCSCPPLDGKVLIMADPMLATGSSMVLSYKALLAYGTPAVVHVVAAIASTQAVDYTKNHFESNMTIWTGAIDDELTSEAYIVPGLGDAGDLAYGEKLEIQE